MNDTRIVARIVLSFLLAPVIVSDVAAAPITQHQPFIEISGSMDGISIANSMSFFEDVTGEMKIDSVIDAREKGKFTKITTQSFSGGITTSVHWFSLTITNSSKEPVSWILNSGEILVNQLDLYTKTAKGEFALAGSAGLDAQGVDSKIYRGVVLSIKTKEKTTETLYLKVTSNYGQNFFFTAWSPDLLASFEGREGFYFGGLIAIIGGFGFFNLMIFFMIRDRGYLYYSLSQATIVLAIFTFFGLILPSENPFFIFFAHRGGHIFGFLGMVFSNLFIRSFLSTDRYLPALNKVLTAILVLDLILFSLAFFAPMTFIAKMLNFFFIFKVVYLGMAIAAHFKGNRSAKYYAYAWFAGRLGVFILALSVFGYIPWSSYMRWGAVTGLALEAVLLSLALASRIQNERMEKELAQAEVIEKDQYALKVLKQSQTELEKKVLERTAAMAKAKDEAIKATEMKDRYISMVSHDLRGPMGTIKLIFDHIKTLIVRDPTQDFKPLLAKGSKTLEGLINFIDQTLIVGRLNSGDLTPMKKGVAIRTVVGYQVESLTHWAEKKGVTLHNDIPVETVLLVDPIIFAQIIQNLLSNAIKFTGPGGHIRIYSLPQEAETIVVTDSGIGIDTSLISDLFRADIKTTTPGIDGEPGTGLGLPFVCQSVYAHGGTIDVNSVVGEGTTFILRLPKKDKVVMIVDDQEASRSQIKQALADMPIDFIEAEGGQEAINQLHSFIPDIILTDMNMPKIDGLKLIELIKENELFCDIPIVALSSATELTIEGKQINIKNSLAMLKEYTFLSKPIDPVILSNTVRSIIPNIS